MKKTTLKTTDGIEVPAKYEKKGETGILLLHQRKLNKESWKELIKELKKTPYSIVTIDFRGHGESKIKFEELKEKDYKKMKKDAEAGLNLLKTFTKKTIIIGASIGANTAIKLSKKTNGVIALSPGINYHGINIKNTKTKTPTLIITAKEDTYSLESSKKINKQLENSKLIITPGEKHGIHMLNKKLTRIIKEFIKKTTSS